MSQVADDDWVDVGEDGRVVATEPFPPNSA